MAETPDSEGKIAKLPSPPSAEETAFLNLNTRLDEIDIRILAVLQREGRITKADLAERVHLSPSACHERMRRLEKKKIIRSYHAVVDLKRLMPVTHFFTEMTLANHRYADFVRFEQYIMECQEVVECHALGGGIDYILKIITPTVERYQLLIEEMLEAQIGIDRYFTYVVTKPIKSIGQLSVDQLLRANSP